MVCSQRRIRKKVSMATSHDRPPRSDVVVQVWRHSRRRGSPTSHTSEGSQKYLLALYRIGRYDRFMRNHSSDLKSKIWWSSAERTANHALVLLNGSSALKAVKNGTEIDEDPWYDGRLYKSLFLHRRGAVAPTLPNNLLDVQ